MRRFTPAFLVGMFLAVNVLVILGAYLLVDGASNPGPIVTYIYGALAVLYWLGYFGWRS